MEEKLWYIGNFYNYKFSFAGISRSSTIIISYMIKKHKFTFEKALERCKSKREKINPNAGFRSQLKKFEETIFNN
jgi:protein-tyrosine phosphatase